MNEIFKMELDGEILSVRMLQRFGDVDPYLTPQKIQELWIEYSKHDTLFSDYTRGKVEPFLDVLFNTRSIILEIYSETEEVPVGTGMITKIIPRFDAQVHFTLWSGKARGKEPLFWLLMQMFMDEFDLKRYSTEVPGMRKGLIRMLQRLGFQHEGTRRAGNIHKGSWVDMEMFGLLDTELADKLKEI